MVLCQAVFLHTSYIWTLMENKVMKNGNAKNKSQLLFI